ncbi:hypothetical protein ACWDR0_34680, partial [Streptomyces sp. NPDC003691]
ALLEGERQVEAVALTAGQDARGLLLVRALEARQVRTAPESTAPPRPSAIPGNNPTPIRT